MAKSGLLFTFAHFDLRGRESDGARISALVVGGTEVCIRLGRRISKLRQQRVWTQTYLEVQTGLRGAFISDLENGKREPCLRSLEILAARVRSVALAYLSASLNTAALRGMAFSLPENLQQPILGKPTIRCAVPLLLLFAMCNGTPWDFDTVRKRKLYPLLRKLAIERAGTGWTQLDPDCFRVKC